jgi:Lon protease-like protein
LKRLPLFPLPVVLLPRAALPLHIFEQRYRRLVARCREADAPFGIVYHDPDVHGPFLIEEGQVGTEARIEVFHPLPDGRSLILVRGGERFRIREGIESEEPFYEAVVEAYPDSEPVSGGPLRLEERRRRSLELFRAAVTAVAGSAEESPEPDAGSETSFLLASRLRIDASWLQALLELRDEGARLERLDVIFHAAASRRPGHPPRPTR